MKQKNLISDKITIQEWLRLKPYLKHTKYDLYYLDVCNKVLSFLSNYNDFFQDVDINFINRKELSCVLTSYFEDFAVEIGIWSSFIKYNQQTIGTYLPFYDLADYDTEYLNVEDIQYLLWHYISKLNGDNVYPPDLEELNMISIGLIDIFEEYLDEAPINDFYSKFFKISDNEDFFVFKMDKLHWLAMKSYLMGIETNKLYQEQLIRFLKKIKNSNYDTDYISKFTYQLLDEVIFNHRCSYAALNASEWFAMLVDCSESKREEIKNLCYLHKGNFEFVADKNKTHFIFRHLFTNIEYEVLKNSMQKNKNFIKDAHLLTVQMNLARWNNTWWLTGTLIGYPKDVKEIEEYKKAPLPNSFWMLPEQQAAQSIQLNHEMNDAFLKLYGQSLVFCTNEKDLQKKFQDFFEYFNKQKANDELTKTNEKNEDTKVKDIVNVNFPASNKKNSDVALFFSNEEGIANMYGLKDTIKLLQKKKRSQDEDGILFFILTRDFDKKIVDYLLEHFDYETLKLPVFTRIDFHKNLHYYQRFYNSESFHKKFPLVIAV